MNWKILNVSIPVKNLEESKDFYSRLLNNKLEDKLFYKNFFENYNEDIFLGEGGFGIRLYIPKQDLEFNGTIQSRRTYITLIIENFDLVLEKLNEKNIKFTHNKYNDFEKIMVQEPSLNLIQLIKSNKVLDENYKKFIDKSNWYIHHMNLESLDVRESVDFVSEFLNLKEGKWTAPVNKGDFSIDPRELSIFPMSSLNKGLHIIKPDDGFGFRNNFAHNPSIAGHPAFTVKDVKKVMDMLGRSKILFSNAEIYAMPKFHQIYLYDQNANMLEINQEV